MRIALYVDEVAECAIDFPDAELRSPKPWRVTVGEKTVISVNAVRVTLHRANGALFRTWVAVPVDEASRLAILDTDPTSSRIKEQHRPAYRDAFKKAFGARL